MVLNELILSLYLLMNLLVRDIRTTVWILSAFLGYSCILLIVPLPVVQIVWFLSFYLWLLREIYTKT